MKKVLFFFLLSLALPLLNPLQAQGSGQSIWDAWPALKTFHGVMSTTFHPAEEGDLQPIRTRSAEMVEKATALAKSEVPAAYQTPAIQAATKKLVSGSKSLHKLVKKQANDAAVTQSITALHDVFHEIVGLCNEEKH